MSETTNFDQEFGASFVQRLNVTYNLLFALYFHADVDCKKIKFNVLHLLYLLTICILLFALSLCLPQARLCQFAALLCSALSNMSCCLLSASSPHSDHAHGHTHGPMHKESSCSSVWAIPPLREAEQWPAGGIFRPS